MPWRLHEAGLTHFSSDMTHYEPSPLTLTTAYKCVIVFTDIMR